MGYREETVERSYGAAGNYLELTLKPLDLHRGNSDVQGKLLSYRAKELGTQSPWLDQGHRTIDQAGDDHPGQPCARPDVGP